MVSGQWSVVSGQWSVVSGQWSVVSGQWSVVSGGFDALRVREMTSCENALKNNNNIIIGDEFHENSAGCFLDLGA